jgi:hypothetical protein
MAVASKDLPALCEAGLFFANLFHSWRTSFAMVVYFQVLAGLPRKGSSQKQGTPRGVSVGAKAPALLRAASASAEGTMIHRGPASACVADDDRGGRRQLEGRVHCRSTRSFGREGALLRPNHGGYVSSVKPKEQYI